MPNPNADEITITKTGLANGGVIGSALTGVQTNLDFNGISSVVQAGFVQRMRPMLPSMARMESWPTESTFMEVPPGASVDIELVLSSEYAFLGEVDDCVVAILIGRGYANVWTAAESETVRKAVAAKVRSLIPDAVRAREAEGSRELMFRFTWLDGDSVQSMSRRLRVAPWEEISDGYPPAARREMARLMKYRPVPGDDSGGKTIIWHGPAGTGKTSAIRSLGWEWRDWCNMVVVTDPERLFGNGAGYLMDQVSSGRGNQALLLVLEDAGELLAADARSEVGQGLSRLLNLCDGLIGQGRQILLLVTTNEPIRTIHPAVRRPGRCLAEIELPPLTTRQANIWLKKRGSDLKVTGHKSLAELYALINGRDEVSLDDTRERVGFGAVLDA